MASPYAFYRRGRQAKVGYFLAQALPHRGSELLLDRGFLTCHRHATCDFIFVQQDSWMSVRLVLSGQHAHLRDAGGIGRYSYELYRRVLSKSIREYLPEGDIVAWDFPDFEEKPNSGSRSESGIPRKLKNAVRPWISRALNAPQKRSPQSTAVPRTIPFNGKSSEPVVFHEMTNYGSCGEIARVVLSPSVRLCVTFHDVQDLFYPEYFADEELRSRRCYYSLYKDVAQQFFAVSQFTKRSMVERLNIPENRIRVTYLGADGFQDSVDSIHDAYAKEFGRYLIYPAKFWKHKNHEFLLRAISARRAEFKRQGLRVLLTGGFTQEDTDALAKETVKHRVRDQVLVLGFQTNQALRALIQNATFLVFPSLFEGFGMPVLEALGSGCPVLCARQASLPEVAGDAAVFFDPTDIDSLVSVFDQVLGGTIDRDKLIAKGKSQFQKFSWDKNFRETAEQYAKLI
jgi:glycosyltransferase involved in cell wall biosynthesis